MSFDARSSPFSRATFTTCSKAATFAYWSNNQTMRCGEQQEAYGKTIHIQSRTIQSSHSWLWLDKTKTKYATIFFLLSGMTLLVHKVFNFLIRHAQKDTPFPLGIYKDIPGLTQKTRSPLFWDLLSYPWYHRNIKFELFLTGFIHILPKAV